MLENVTAGLITAALIAFITWLFKKRFSNRLRGGFAGAKDIIGLFDNADEAYPDIEKEALCSRKVCYAGSYNTTFFCERPPEQTLLYRILAKTIHDQKGNLPDIRFVHLHPDSRFIQIRSEELGSPGKIREIQDGIIHCHAHIHQVEEILHLKQGTIGVRYADSHLVFRLILLDNCAYVSHYTKGTMGKQTRVLKIRKNSEMYNWFERHFDVLWTYGSTDSMGAL